MGVGMLMGAGVLIGVGLLMGVDGFRHVGGCGLCLVWGCSWVLMGVGYRWVWVLMAMG